MVLVGIQPVLTQVPPNSFRSITATDIPAAVSRPASGGPACPAPMTIASKLRLMMSTTSNRTGQQLGLTARRSRTRAPRQLAHEFEQCVGERGVHDNRDSVFVLDWFLQRLELAGKQR